jgi:phospholipase C
MNTHLIEQEETMTKLTFPVAIWVAVSAIQANLQLAHAQVPTTPPHFDHIVIIVQENRTPDTLFGGDPKSASTVCGNWNGFAAGVDLANGGANKYVSSGCSLLAEVKNLNVGGGTHSNEDWQGQYDNGAMDGACDPVTDKGVNCSTGKGPYIYVKESVVKPYLDIATDYGWANYMFQTNEGPSFPAHQFLFGGTSAPVWPSLTYANYFVADNPPFTVSGCDEAPDGTLPWVDPTGDPNFVYPTPNSLGQNTYECYDRNTMVTTQNGAAGTVSARTDTSGSPITWAYYAQAEGIIWNAPEANPQTCYGLNSAPTPGQACSGAEYANVILPGTGTNESAPILTDIASCKLPEITWVTPDEVWSDHPGDLPSTDKGYPGLGPAWVADIINEIGESKKISKGACDYWKAEPTAIFVVWDDWGGFFDHVIPPAVYVGGPAPNYTCSAPNSWGCGYVYGFRVPLLVVSPYTTAGTVSGAFTTWPPPNPPNNPCWIHDFGSILAFTEQNFYPSGSQSIAPPGYSYADSNTLDTQCQGQTVVPLWEFFNGPFRDFTEIPSPHPPSFFTGYYNTTGADGKKHIPQGPDADDWD